MFNFSGLMPVREHHISRGLLPEIVEKEEAINFEKTGWFKHCDF
jgi:hypothetical protein